MTSTRIALAAGLCLLAFAARGEEPKLERGTKVLAKSPDFVLSDGDKVIRSGSPLERLRVENVDRDRARLYRGGHEGDADVSEVVCVDDAEAYFSDQIKANRGGGYAYLMRANARAYRRDLANAARDCDEAIRREPKNPWVHVLRAAIRGGQGDSKGAALEFEEAIKLDQSNAAAYFGLAQCHMGEKNYDKALSDLEEAIRRDAKSGVAYVMRGMIWLEKGDGEKALREFNEAIRVDPKGVGAYSTLAAYFVQREEYDKARAELDEAIRIDPKNGEPYSLRAWIAQFKGDLDRALADLDVAIRLDPRNVDSLILRADCLRSRNEIAKAFSDINEALRLEPKNDKALAKRAELLVRTGDQRSALEDLNQSIMSNPQDVIALGMRATLLVNEGKFASALQDVDKALEIDPKNADALTQRALIVSLKRSQERTRGARGTEPLIDIKNGKATFKVPFDVRPRISSESKEDDKSLNDLNKLIKSEPQNASTYTTRGFIFMQTHDFDKARADFDKAIAINPNAVTYSNRAAMWIAMNDLKRAVDDYDRAVLLDRGASPVRLERAKALCHLGRFDLARDDLNAVLAESPLNAEAFAWRGGTWEQKGDLIHAMSDYSEAIRLNPKDTHSRGLRGKIHHSRAEYAEAPADFDEIVRLAPESPSSSAAYLARAIIRTSSKNAQFRDARLAVESATKACELTVWKEVGCICILALGQNLSGDAKAAIASIDKCIALLKPGDKRLEKFQKMREGFRQRLLSQVGVKNFLELEP